LTAIRVPSLGLPVILGGALGGVLLGFVHSFVLAYMALLVSVQGAKVFGRFAFILNGTASALLMALVLGVPLGYLTPRFATPIAILSGTVAAVFLLSFSLPVVVAQFSWWVSLADGLQLPVLLIAGAWFGSRLRAPDNVRT